MSFKRKVETFAGLTPAIAIAICVCMTLSGYTEPTYSIDEVSRKVPETPELKTLSVDIPTRETEEIEDIEEPAAYKDGTYYGSAMGYNGNIKVKVVIKNGKIHSIEIVSHVEDQPYLNNARNSILPAIINGQTTNVDTVSGATFSSNGIIGAVRDALAKAAISEEAKNNLKTDAGNSDDKTEQQVEMPEMPEDDTEEVPENYIYKDGVYTNDDNMVLCEHPRDTSWAYYLSVKVTIKDGKITEIKESKKVGKGGAYNNQNDSYLSRAFKGLGSRKGMEAKIVEAQGTAGVDAVTGATISSVAIVQSVNIILPQIEKIPVEVEEEVTEDEVTEENAPLDEVETVLEEGETLLEEGDTEASDDEEAAQPEDDEPAVKEEENETTENEEEIDHGEIPD